MSNRLGTFVAACLSLGLAGYAFVFGTLVLSGVVDIYYEYSLSVITHPVDLVPIPFVASLLQTVLIVAFLLIISYYLSKPSWKDIKLSLLTLVRENSSSTHSPTPEDETETSKPPSLSPLQARKQELLLSFVCLMLASIVVLKIYGVYFASAPHDLGYLITLNPLPLKLPILAVILIGFGLWVSAIYLLKEALDEFRWLEQTQLAHQLNQHKEKDDKKTTDPLG